MVCGANILSGLKLPWDEKNKWSRGVIDGIDVIGLPLTYSNRDGLLRRTFTFLRFALRGIRVALTEPYDLLFATSTPLTAAIPGIFARWLRRKSFVFEVRDLWPELPRAMGMRNPFLLGGMSLLERLAYHSCIGAIGLAPGIVEGIRKRSPKELPIAMVPNGCDLELFRPDLTPAFASVPTQADGFVAGFTGAHGLANGLDAVLDAAAVLKQRGRMDIRIVLVGEGGQKERLRTSAKDRGLNNVTFMESMPKLKLREMVTSLGCGLQTLANVPAFYYGTSPNKFFDYIAAGLPVLINYPGWLADLVQKHACGLAVPPENPTAFADALIHLADDRHARTQMGRNARRLAETSFARTSLAAQWIDFLEALGQARRDLKLRRPLNPLQESANLHLSRGRDVPK